MINYIIKKSIVNTFLILSVIWFVACNDNLNNISKQPYSENAKVVKVQLLDSLGTITISIPLRYDTNFSWIHYSDCGKPCETQKYRFQPKLLRITKESGWFWLGEPKDSIERFTISHSKYIILNNSDTSKNVIRHNHIKEQLSSDPLNPKIIFDTIQKINDRYFTIIEMEQGDTIQSKKLLAVTTIQSNQIKFQCELLTKKNDSIAKNFFNNSMNIIKSIQIKKGI